ncbi:MAG: recombination mediator RecR [bacterium]|nr:recombination mediator RecR [bacterium]
MERVDKGLVFSKFVSLMKKFMMLPGVGEKTATRFVLFLIQSPTTFVESFAKDIMDIKSKIRLCEKCFFIAEGNLCKFCSDESRDKTKICVVEGIEDVISVEKSGVWNGLYHVLWGVISAQEGIGFSDIKVKELISRVALENISEVLILTDTTVEGEATAMYIKKLLEKFNVKVTRPAYGIPFGAEVEYIDTATLKKALESRKEITVEKKR